MLVDVLDVELAGGSFHHDIFLVAGVELVHESWRINVDRLMWSLETLGLDDHSVRVHHADVVDFLEAILLMYRI